MQTDRLIRFRRCLLSHPSVKPTDGVDDSNFWNLGESLIGVEFELSEARVHANFTATSLQKITWETMQKTVSLFKSSINSVETIFWENSSRGKIVSAQQSELIQFSSTLFDINDNALLENHTKALIGALEALLNLAEEELFYVEGAEIKVHSKRLERSRALRDKAVEIHGTKCAICGFSFKDKYGIVGDGFIHIHHIESLADTGERLVNPATDLIPVCPNCHAMLHKQHPPFLPKELINFLKEARSG